MRRSESEKKLLELKYNLIFSLKLTDNKMHFIINISLIYKDNEESENGRRIQQRLNDNLGTVEI